MSDSQQRYRVVEKLESGGMAEVFRAESEGLQGFRKQVAIKRVLPHLSSKKKFISMFLDEARLSAQLSHSNCVQVFDIGVGDNAFFIVMEFVDGANLKAIIEHIKKTGRDFPVEAAVYIALEICKGLAYAHELTDPQRRAAPHRPPRHVAAERAHHEARRGEDRGLRPREGQQPARKERARDHQGQVLATSSPEAAMGQDVDARTDIFAVGIILWELLAGQRLFLGDTDFQTVKKVQAAQVPRISQINKKVPPELETHHQQGARPRSRAALPRPRASSGMDLSKFMFKFGVPVSTFDIAHARAGRDEGAAAAPPDAGEHHRQAHRRGALRVHVAHRRQGRLPAAARSRSTRRRSPAPLKPPGRSAARVVDVGSWIDEIAVGQKPETGPRALAAASSITRRQPRRARGRRGPFASRPDGPVGDGPSDGRDAERPLAPARGDPSDGGRAKEERDRRGRRGPRRRHGGRRGRLVHAPDSAPLSGDRTSRVPGRGPIRSPSRLMAS